MPRGWRGIVNEATVGGIDADPARTVTVNAPVSGLETLVPAETEIGEATTLALTETGATRVLALAEMADAPVLVPTETVAAPVLAFVDTDGDPALVPAETTALHATTGVWASGSDTVADA